jgi:hypothetical protein
MIRRQVVMIIKDILATLPTGDAPSFALDYAITVARAFDAHLTGIAFVQDGASLGTLFDRATGIALDDYRREEEASAEAAEVRFEKRRQLEGPSPPNRWFSTQKRSAFLNSLHAPREDSI